MNASNNKQWSVGLVLSIREGWLARRLARAVGGFRTTVFFETEGQDRGWHGSWAEGEISSKTHFKFLGKNIKEARATIDSMAKGATDAAPKVCASGSEAAKELQTA